MMTRTTHVYCFLVLALAGLAGCSSDPPAKQAAAAAPDKIQGKARSPQRNDRIGRRS